MLVGAQELRWPLCRKLNKVSAFRLTILKTHNSTIPAVGAMKVWGNDPKLGTTKKRIDPGSVSGKGMSLCSDGEIFSGGLFTSSYAARSIVDDDDVTAPSPSASGTAGTHDPDDRFNRLNVFCRQPKV